MARRSWKVSRVSDEAVLQRFARIAAKVASSPFAIEGRLLGAHISEFVDTPPPAVEALIANKSAAANWALNFKLLSSSVHLNRPDDKSSDELILNVPDGRNPLEVAKLFGAVESEFPSHVGTENVEEVIGHELANFYQSRDAALVKLEALSQRLIEDTATYRREVEKQADQIQQQRVQAIAAEREEMQRAVAAEREAIERRADEVEAEKQRVDDRAAKYARRGLRESLQNALRQYGERFSLTSETSKKRLAVHILFCGLIALAIVLVVSAIVEQWGAEHSWHYYLRVGIGTLTTVGAVVFYIRWADNWFSRLADEELRLKRLGIDIDRASWLVETAMEWQQEYKVPIPDLLLTELSRDLFTSDKTEVVRHPAEDALSSILGAASVVFRM